MDSVPTIVARYIDAYNRMNVQAMLDCLSGDVRFINRSNGETTNETHGIEAFRALAEQGVQLFAEREQTILDCIAIDDRAAVRIGYRGPDSRRAAIVADIAAGRHADVADGQLEGFIAQLGQQAALAVATRREAIPRG